MLELLTYPPRIPPRCEKKTRHELLESMRRFNAERLNQLHALSAFDHELSAEIKQLESERDQSDFELSKPNGPTYGWSGAP